MIQFEKSSGRWKGWGFSRQPDYRFVDCQRSVMPPLSSFRAERGEDPEPSGARKREPVADTVPEQIAFGAAGSSGLRREGAACRRMTIAGDGGLSLAECRRSVVTRLVTSTINAA